MKAIVVNIADLCPVPLCLNSILVLFCVITDVFMRSSIRYYACWVASLLVGCCCR